MTPNASITGKSGKEYFFIPQLISDDSDCWPVNLFLFAKLFKHDADTREWVYTTKDKANYKLCLVADPNIDKDFVIEDLKEDGTYKIKIDYIKT